jgi:hypothetical protein
MCIPSCIVIPLRRLGELSCRTGVEEQGPFLPTSLVTLGSYLYALDGSRLGMFPEPPSTGHLQPYGPPLHEAVLHALVYVPHVLTFAGYPLGALVGLPSRAGSKLLLWRLDEKREPSGRPECIDASAMVEALRARVDDLNVVAGAVNGSVLSLFHRSDRSGNARLDVDIAVFAAALARGEVPYGDAIVGVRFYDLGNERSHRTGFVDASPLRDGRVVFAAADGTSSSIGVMDQQGSIRSLEAVAPTLSVSGLAAQLEPDRIDLLLSVLVEERTVLFAAELSG